MPISVPLKSSYVAPPLGCVRKVGERDLAHKTGSGVTVVVSEGVVVVGDLENPDACVLEGWALEAPKLVRVRNVCSVSPVELVDPRSKDSTCPPALPTLQHRYNDTTVLIVIKIAGNWWAYLGGSGFKPHK